MVVLKRDRRTMVKSLRIGVGIAAIGVILGGCSTNEIKINPTTRSLLAGQQEIVAIHYAPSPFAAQTPEVRNAASAGELFGAIGGAIAGAVQASEAERVGSQLIRDYSLEDPILKIKRTFLDAVSRDLNIQNLLSAQDVFVDDDTGQLKRKFQKGFVFDFKTTSWSLTPVPFGPNNYRVQYKGRARLLSFPEGKVEWQGGCEADGKIESSAPTLLQLVANSGAILKTQLGSTSDSCLEQLERQFMGSKH